MLLCHLHDATQLEAAQAEAAAALTPETAAIRKLYEERIGESHPGCSSRGASFALGCPGALLWVHLLCLLLLARCLPVIGRTRSDFVWLDAFAAALERELREYLGEGEYQSTHPLNQFPPKNGHYEGKAPSYDDWPGAGEAENWDLLAGDDSGEGEAGGDWLAGVGDGADGMAFRAQMRRRLARLRWAKRAQLAALARAESRGKRASDARAAGKGGDLAASSDASSSSKASSGSRRRGQSASSASKPSSLRR